MIYRILSLLCVCAGIALAQCPAGSVPNRQSRDLADRTHIIECIRRSDGLLVLPDFSGPLISTNYNFAPISRSTPMKGGAAFTLNVSPCPEGVNGTNTNHWLRLQDPTGVSESVLITGGTCISGRPVGTIRFTPANNHPGQWILQSATAGIQEAIWAVPDFSTLFIPGGFHTIQATITKPAVKKLSIMGAGSDITSLRASFAGGNTLYVDAAYAGYYTQVIKGIGFLPTVARTSGSELYVKNAQYAHFDDIYSGGAFIGLTFENFNSITARSLRTLGSTGYGMRLLANTGTSGGLFSDCLFNIVAGGNAGALIISAAGASISGLTISNSAFQGSPFNIYVDPLGGTINEVKLQGNDYDGASTYSIDFVAPTGGSGADIQINGGRFGPLAGTAGLLYMSKDWTRVKVEGTTGGTAGNGTGFTFAGTKNVNLLDNVIAGGADAGANDISLYLILDGATPVTNLKAVGNKFGYAYDGSTAGYVARFGMVVSAAAHTFEATGNSFYGSTSGLVYAGTGKGVFRQNIFTNTIKPTCDATTRSSDWFTESAPGVLDLDEVCRKDALNAYAWTNRL